MTEERLTYLLDQYHHQTISVAETIELERWYEDTQLAQQPLIRESDNVAMAAFREDMWADMEDKVTPGKAAPAKMFRLNRARWMVAAAIVIIAGLAAIRLAQAPLKQHLVEQPVLAQRATGTITNHSGRDSSFHLPDGSRVILTGRSAISYRDDSSSGERSVLLMRGKAFFDVSKDPKHPFIVYSGILSTKALGTSFTVSQEAASEITIQLHEGKVVIKSVGPGKQFDPVYLAPGHQLLVNTGSMLASVSRINHTDKKNIKHKSLPSIAVPATQLTFNQEPLEQVFARLEKPYQQEIVLHLPQAENFDFSGTITTTDSLGKVLDKIAKLHGLVVRKTARGYTISK